MSRPINKEWMNENNRVGPVYMKGVEEFLEFANANIVRPFTTLTCPCRKCRNRKRYKSLDVRNHLIRNGIDRSYSLWALHGEKPYRNSINHRVVDDVYGENIEEENIEVGGLGMENLVDASYGMHKETHVNDDSGQAGVLEEPYVGNEKYNEYKRLSIEKQYLMQQEILEKQVRRIDKWPTAHERSDGTALESAKSKHDEVIATGHRRKRKSLIDEGCNDTCEDLDSDELAEVFGKESKGGVRVVGSHVSKKQLIQLGVARSKIEQKGKANEEAASFKDEIISRLNNFENVLMSLVSNLSNVSTPPLVTTPSSDVGSHSINRPTHLGQNSNNVFATTDILNSPYSMLTPADKPPVILLDKFGKELAKGYVVTDASAKVCHFKTVGIGEKKVFIEEVIDPNARLWDPPQGGHDTLAGFVQGGCVIWLECWLRHV